MTDWRRLEYSRIVSNRFPWAFVSLRPAFYVILRIPFIGWTFITILILFVNSIVWAGNLSSPAPVWCDI
ncbi:unnamed protein product [Rhizoctonia solani]|uniref:Uncharacterized protein n=1 Tax=Rhizoctonia solani TaxID=456999 RepID=A0A8H3HYU2_9AGAM|nr:unnamed protein product [Rhizoctonia solani]